MVSNNNIKFSLSLLLLLLFLSSVLLHPVLIILLPVAVVVDGFPITTTTTTTTTTSWNNNRLRRMNRSSTLSLSMSTSSSNLLPLTQVISDVDDTLKSSGGVTVAGVVALGGIDVQYARGELYPGVAEFYWYLSVGVNNNHAADRRNNGGSGWWRRLLLGKRSRTTTTTTDTAATAPVMVAPPKVAILTARAEEFKWALEMPPSHPIAVALRNTGYQQSGGMVKHWGLGPVLYGSVAEWIVQDRKGLRKFTNFERLLQQDATGQVLHYVYVGDTGEFDAEAGETMLREYPQVVQAVFLHVVSNQRSSSSSSTTAVATGATTTTMEEAASNDNNIVVVPPPKFIQGRPLIYFRTYVGAALAAVQIGLMSVHGLEQVMIAAQQQLDHVPRTSDKWIDVQRDIDRAQRAILGGIGMGGGMLG